MYRYRGRKPQASIEREKRERCKMQSEKVSSRRREVGGRKKNRWKTGEKKKEKVIERHGKAR